MRGYAFIILTKGELCLVDREDFDYLSKFNWQAAPTRTKKGFYAVRNNGYNEKGTRLKVKMHREIMDCPDGLEVDHINGDTLDNRRCNLRICTYSENIKNQKKRKGSSNYSGVYKHLDKWRVTICVNYKIIHVGLYKTELEANEAAINSRKKYYGKFTNDT